LHACVFIYFAKDVYRLIRKVWGGGGETTLTSNELGQNDFDIERLGGKTTYIKQHIV
jgi:hypothetical protein